MYILQLDLRKEEYDLVFNFIVGCELTGDLSACIRKKNRGRNNTKAT